jgi:type III pantothenate kinase
MLLTIDVGNSNIVIGASRNDTWDQQWRIVTNVDATSDEYAVIFKNLFEEAGLLFKDFDRVIIGSVVPRLTQTFQEVFRSRSGIESIIVSGRLETGIAIKTDHPDAIGADLIAGAAAAYHRYQQDCLVVDFGTATTIMAVKKPGELMGGAICSGLKVTVDALVGKAAQLYQIPLEPPGNVMGRNTVEAMQSGLVLGHLCMVEGLVERMKKELNDAKVIATGGLAESVSNYTDCFDAVDSMLILNGLRLIADRVNGGGAKGKSEK